MIEQGVDDPGDLCGGFGKASAGPGAEQLGDGTGVELRLVVVGPYFQALELIYALLHDRLLQKMVKPPLFDQGQPLPLGIQIGVDCQNMLVDPAGGQGDRPVDLPIHGGAVLPDHILRQIEVAVKGGPAHTGLFDELGDGDFRQLPGFQQLEESIGDVGGDASLFHDTNVSHMFHFGFRILHPLVNLVKIRKNMLDFLTDFTIRMYHPLYIRMIRIAR